MAEAFGYHHYQGSSHADDVVLHKKGLDRMYDSYMPNKVYEEMEDFFKANFDQFKDLKTIKEFLWKVGSLLPTKEKSILVTCAKKKIPLFCKALSDSDIGLMIWGQLARGINIDTNAFEDLREILQIAWNSKKSGVFYVGGGVPKNFIQQAMQFSPKAAEFGIQITTDRPEFGGSSGAELKEGISWGKMNPNGRFVNVSCDATIALPLIWAGIK